MSRASIQRYANSFFRDMTSLGSGYIIGFIGLIFFLFDRINIFLKIIFILVITYVISAIIRLFYFKDRPKKQEYDNILDKIDASSFPSVHAGRVVSVAMLIIDIFPNLIYLISVITIIVIYSRIYLRKHYLIDVLGGIVLGLIVYWLAGVVI